MKVVNDNNLVATGAITTYTDDKPTRFVIRKTVGMMLPYSVSKELLSYNELLKCFTHYLYKDLKMYCSFDAAMDDFRSRVEI